MIARKDKRIHLRVFDETGARVEDTDHEKLPDGATELLGKLGSSPAGQKVDDQLKRDIIRAVAPVVGVGWRWRQLPGNGFRLMKRKNTSFDYCDALIEAGKNMRTSPKAGRD
ncbi:hypothetical protein DFH01_23515 [Falsiroseomonas bella]|uniref:Uncharacterized protein n=1 Tax=Falsiroseomonas bella TaxID=2184016 RepID=A0A317F925_9PROT|nr:hypothetical protein [Falsiroseomonas bella]PWS34517.1 hypothetical protein DFH01_23515 [Falsiroseomonas bella]